MDRFNTRTAGLVFITLFLFLAGTVSAVPPTDEAVAKWKAEGRWEEVVAQWKSFKAAGGCAPSEKSPLQALRESRTAANAAVVDTIRVPVILVEFSDWPASGQGVSSTPADFQRLLFSRRGVDVDTMRFGSMTDYYFENSYGKLVVIGDIFGWYMMPNTYAYYVGTDNGMARGSELASAAILAANSSPDNVDFSLYTNGDSKVDGVIVIHSGGGAEARVYGIWSHRSNVALSLDGVSISDYTLNPEEFSGSLSTMGVFAHEYGHILGLPDLYDVGNNGGASGLGRWSLMAGGSWNGSPAGAQPAHMNAWSKSQPGVGFLNPIWLTTNVLQAEIPTVQYNDVAYVLGSVPGNSTFEYWIVENRQRLGFDQSLPGGGLMMYHFDPSGSMANPDRYRVSVEQADGKRDLETNGISDAGDPWPGTRNNRTFHTYTTPNSNKNNGATTKVGVWDISNPDSIMYADLDIAYSRPYAIFEPDSVKILDNVVGNSNGIPEAGETMNAYFKVKSVMGLGFDPTFTLSVDIPGVTFIQNDVSLKSPVLGVNFASYNEIPIVFSLPSDFEPIIATFTLTVISNKTSGGGDRSNISTLTFEKILGRTQVVVIDDDNGQNLNLRITKSLDRLRIPYGYRDKSIIGTPTMADLSGYASIVWHTGRNSPPSMPGGTLTAQDIAFLKEWMDSGRNVYLSSMTAASQLHSLDSTFLANYFHVTFDRGGEMGFSYAGEPNNPVSDNIAHDIFGLAPIDPTNNQIITPANGGQVAYQLHQFEQLNGPIVGVCGVSFEGSYRSLFTTFGFEHITETDKLTFGVFSADTLMQRVISFFARGIATPVEEDHRDISLPAGFSLAQNYPNPFNPSTTISYSVEARESGSAVATRLVVYNSLGQKVKTLVDDMKRPGNYIVVWNGKNDNGAGVATGIYFYRLENGDQAMTRKMVLLK